MTDWAGLEARNEPLNAFVDWDRQARGGDGALSGVTIGVKSNIAVKGLPWTGGMGLRRGIIAERDAAVVAQLRKAGAIILGTLNMHEAALGATTDNAFYGRTHNPQRNDYTPGGSSGGSGAAVAAGLCDAALGTDTLGSVRIPAAYCGVYGLKPTHGALSHNGLLELEPAFDCIGPLARDLEMLERVWRALRRQSAGEAKALSKVLVLEPSSGIEVQPSVRAAYECALAQLGAPAKEIAFEDAITDIRMAGFVAAGQWLIADLGAARRTKADGISRALHFMLDLCEQTAPRPDVLARTRAALIAAIGDDGVLVMPTAPQAAFAHGTRAPANQADFTCLASIAGLPALAIPMGTDDDGLPVSVQIVGPQNSETRLIALARQLEGIS